jgi:hypothetical protein
MIKLSATYHRNFAFPADLDTCFAYYSRLTQTLGFLPHISIVKSYRENQFRVLYSTTELGIYRVNIYCDLQMHADSAENRLVIQPLHNGTSPTKSSFGLYSLTGQGYYSSESIFSRDGEQTIIDFMLQMHSSLPVPLALKLMPESVISKIANEITTWRMREIADGFMQRSIQAFTSTRS